MTPWVRRAVCLGRPMAAALLMACASCATTGAHHPPCGAHSFVSSANRCIPEAWFCSPMLYGSGDGCDCNCGAKDPDCRGRNKTWWCYGLGMPRQVPSCALCDAAPGERLLQQLHAEP